MAALALLWAGAAGAQAPTEEVARAELIRQAEEAREAGDHARSLDLAARAGRLRMTPSLALLLAQEHGALGHLLDALAMARRCALDAEADENVRNRRRLLAACTSLVDTLAARLARVTLRVPSPAPEGLTVTVNAEALREAFWNVPYPVPPGVVTVEARAPGAQPFRQELQLREGDQREVRVVLAPGAAPAVPPRGTVAPPPPRGPATPPAGPSPAWRWWREEGAWVLGVGAGASLALTGLFLGLRALSLSERDTLSEQVRVACDLDATRCNYSDALRADRSARTYNTDANVFLGVGLTLAAGSLAWWLFLRPSPSRAPRVAVVPSPGGVTFHLGGTL